MINKVGQEQSFTSKVRISYKSAQTLSDFCNFARGNNLENLDGNFQKNLLRQINRLKNNGNDDVVTISLLDWDRFCLQVVEKSGRKIKIGFAQKNLFDYMEHKPLSLSKLYKQAKSSMQEVSSNSFVQYV